MKRLVTALSVCLLWALGSYAQTSLPTTLPATNTPAVTATNSMDQFISAGKQVLIDGWSALKGANFGDGLVAGPFAIYHNGDWGVGAQVSTAHTNGVNLGFAVAAVNETQVNQNTGAKFKDWKFYDAALSLQWTKTVTLPLVNWDFDYFIETGPATDLRDPTSLYSQNLTGLHKTFVLSKTVGLDFGGGAGYLTRWPDKPFFLGGANIVWKPKGW